MRVVSPQGTSQYFEEIEVNCTGTDTVWTLLAGRVECVSRCFADEQCWIAAYQHSTGNCTVATENVIPTENVIHYIFGYYIFGFDRPTENVITENVISPIIKKVAQY